MLALNAGMRDAEIRTLQWARLDLAKMYLTVGDSKTEAGEGRTMLNTSLVDALVQYSKWYTKRFGIIQPDWYVFAFGNRLRRNAENDPTGRHRSGKSPSVLDSLAPCSAAEHPKSVTRYSILELCSVKEGGNAAESFRNTRARQLFHPAIPGPSRSCDARNGWG